MESLIRSRFRGKGDKGGWALSLTGWTGRFAFPSPLPYNVASESMNVNSRSRNILFPGVAVLIVIIDQLTKSWVRTNLLPGTAWSEVWHVRIAHVQNSGSAFGMFTNQTFLLTIVAIIGVLFILAVYRRFASTTLSTVSLSLILGGATGNLIDRLRLGYVTDFIDVRLWDRVYWPAFNVADSCISVGAILLLASVFLSAGNRGKENSQPDPTGT